MWQNLRRWWQLRGLLRRLRSQDPESRRQAAHALGHIPDVRAARALVAAFQDPQEDVAREAAAGAVGHGERALEPLGAALQHADPCVAKRAVDALARIGDGRATEPLLNLVKYGPYEIRREAITALTRLAQPATPLLRQALGDAYPYVRAAAAGALAGMGSAAVPVLTEALRDPDAGVRRQAAELLGRIGDAGARPALADALKDADPGVRQAAEQALKGAREA